MVDLLGANARNPSRNVTDFDLLESVTQELSCLIIVEGASYFWQGVGCANLSPGGDSSRFGFIRTVFAPPIAERRSQLTH